MHRILGLNNCALTVRNRTAVERLCSNCLNPSFLGLHAPLLRYNENTNRRLHLQSNFDKVEGCILPRIPISAIGHLARRGMEKGYTRFDEDIRGIRGRIDVLTTGRRFLLKHGRAQCAFDELTIDTLANQIIKATLLRLAHDRDINKENRSAVMRCAANLRNVATITVSSQSFRKIQLNRNSGSYRFLLNVCELIHDSWLPDQTTGRHRFRDFVRDEAKMALVFQTVLFETPPASFSHLIGSRRPT